LTFHVLLLDAGAVIVDMQRADHAIGDEVMIDQGAGFQDPCVAGVILCRFSGPFQDLQSAHDHVQIHPVYAFHLQNHMLVQHFGHGLWWFRFRFGLRGALYGQAIALRRSQASTAPHESSGASQLEFSSASRRIRTRNSVLTFGQPPDGTAIAKVEAGSAPSDDRLRHDDEDLVHRDHKLCRTVQKSRSQEVRSGRGRFRLRTATCCRRARTSRDGVAPTAEDDPGRGQEGRVYWNTNSRL